MGCFQQDSEPAGKGAPSWLACNSLLWQHLLAAGLEHLKPWWQEAAVACGALGGRLVKGVYIVSLNP